MLKTYGWVMAISMAITSSVRAAEMQYRQTMHDSIPLYGTQDDAPRASFGAVTSPNDNVVITSNVTFAGAVVCNDILIREGGMLTLLPGFDVKCRNFIIDGGIVEWQGNGTLTIRDIPIDTTVDPSQWGAGLIGITGEFRTKTDAWRLSKLPLQTEAKAGAKSIIVNIGSVNDMNGPKGWKAGDKLVFPDTRQPTGTADDYAQTEVATIAGNYRNTIHLTAPLQYDHNGWRDAAGVVRVLPEVGCLNQPFVIKSENPNGTRAHSVFTYQCSADVLGVEFRDMGRTTFAPLDNTTYDDNKVPIKIGTNQVGRYTAHFHHFIGDVANPKPFQGSLRFCCFNSSPKWGVSDHNSFYVNISDCFAYDCAGAGFVTEEIQSCFFRWDNNLVIAKQAGSGLNIVTSAPEGQVGRSHREDPKGDFWHNRVAYGFGSLMGQVTRNSSYCATTAFGFAGFGESYLWKPKYPGVCVSCNQSNSIPLGMSRGYGDLPRRYPILGWTEGNMAWGGNVGVETWKTHSFIDKAERFLPGMMLVHCRKPTLFFDQHGTALERWRILGDWTKLGSGFANANIGYGTQAALRIKDKYDFDFYLLDCELAGYDIGYRMFSQGGKDIFRNCKFQCRVNIFQPEGHIPRFGSSMHGFYDCEFLPIPNHPFTMVAQGQNYAVGLRVNGSEDFVSKPAIFEIKPYVNDVVFNGTVHPQLFKANVSTPVDSKWPGCAAYVTVDGVQHKTRILSVDTTNNTVMFEQLIGAVGKPVTFKVGRDIRMYYPFQRAGTPLPGGTWAGIPAGATTTDQIPVYGAVTPSWKVSDPAFRGLDIATIAPPQ